MSDCKVYRREIVEGFDDELSRGARAHSDVCRACADELRGRKRLRALVRDLGRVEAPSDFEFRLGARMAASGAKGRRGPLGGLRLVYAFAPVAAAACFLVVSTALYLRQASRTGPSAPPPAVAESPQDVTTAQTAAAPPAGEVKGSGRTGVEVVGGGSSSVTPLVRQAGLRRRGAARRSREVAARLDARPKGAQRNTSVFSLTQAPVISGRGVTIALKTTAEPMRMILRDERGAGRVVPMRAVSFGSQALIARENVSGPGTVAENEGVW
jgi:hypothetical protein